MNKFISIILLFFIINQFGYSQKIAPEKPSLIVIYVIEGLSYNQLYHNKHFFSEKGFNRIIEQGQNYSEAYIPFHNNSKYSVFASLMSGSYPSKHGLIGNKWLNSETGELKEAVDEMGKYPVNMEAYSFSDELMKSNKRKSKVFCIADETEKAILLGGYFSSASFWPDDETGSFLMTRPENAEDFPWRSEFNNKAFSDLYFEKEWNLFYTRDRYFGHDLDSELTGFGKSEDLNLVGRFIENSKKNYRTLKETPFGNNMLKDFAIETIVNEDLGKDNYTDVVIVSFGSVEKIIQKFGVNSLETKDAIFRMDEIISHSLDFLDSEIGNKDYLFILCSDGGYSETMELAEGLPGGVFNPERMVLLIRAYLNASLGNGEWVLGHANQSIYLNHELINNSQYSLEEIQSMITGFVREMDGIELVTNSTSLSSGIVCDKRFEGIKHSFYYERSGDIFYKLLPEWQEKIDSKAIKNTASKSSLHIPLIIYGWRTGRKFSSEKIEVIDIAPTISNILKISLPEASSTKNLFDK